MQLFLTPVFGAGGRVLGGAISRSNPPKKIATKKAQNSQNVSDFFWIFWAFLWPFPASPGTLVPVGPSPGLGLQAAVNRFHEHIGRPGAGIGAVTRIVIGRWPGRFDLCQRGALIDQGPNAIPDDHHHVAVLQDLMLIGQVTVGRDNRGSTLSFVLIAGKAQDVIQRLDLALHAAAVL